jgi:hypothetical protein
MPLMRQNSLNVHLPDLSCNVGSGSFADRVRLPTVFFYPAHCLVTTGAESAPQMPIKDTATLALAQQKRRTPLQPLSLSPPLLIGCVTLTRFSCCIPHAPQVASIVNSPQKLDDCRGARLPSPLST